MELERFAKVISVGVVIVRRIVKGRLLKRADEMK